MIGFNIHEWLVVKKDKNEIGLQTCNFFKKETPTPVFSCGICETLKNSGGCFWKHVTYYIHNQKLCGA